MKPEFSKTPYSVNELYFTLNTIFDAMNFYGENNHDPNSNMVCAIVTMEPF